MNAPASLAGIGAGFAAPVQAAQQVFRTLLDAMARPGTVHELPAAALAGLQAPAALGDGPGALMLALLDADTDVHLGAGFDTAPVHGWLRFHTGTQARPLPRAAFVLLAEAQADAALWPRLRQGSDEAPQEGATLVLIVPELGDGTSPDSPASLALRLEGPGIRGRARLAVASASPDRARAFWWARIAQQASFPRGVDLVLVAGTRVAAIPRSTRLALEEA